MRTSETRAGTRRIHYSHSDEFALLHARLEEAEKRLRTAADAEARVETIAEVRQGISIRNRSRKTGNARKCGPVSGVETACFQEICQHMPEVVGTWTSDGKCVFLNRAGRAILGLSDGEDPAEHPPAAFHPREAMKGVVEPAFRVAAEHGVWSGESRMVDCRGRSFGVWETVFAHRDGEGKVACFSIMARDITDEQERERELLRTFRILEIQEDFSRAGILVENETHHLIRHNSRLNTIFGIPAGDLRVGMKNVIPERLTPELADPAGFLSGYTRFRRSGDLRWATTALLANGNKLELHVSAIYREAEDDVFGWVWFFRVAERDALNRKGSGKRRR